MYILTCTFVPYISGNSKAPGVGHVLHRETFCACTVASVPGLDLPTPAQLKRARKGKAWNRGYLYCTKNCVALAKQNPCKCKDQITGNYIWQ